MDASSAVNSTGGDSDDDADSESPWPVGDPKKSLPASHNYLSWRRRRRHRVGFVSRTQNNATSLAGLLTKLAVAAIAAAVAVNAFKPSASLPQALPVTWLAGHKEHYGSSYQAVVPDIALLEAGDPSGVASVDETPPGEDGGFETAIEAAASTKQGRAENESTWSQLLSALFYSTTTTNTTNPSSSEHESSTQSAFEPASLHKHQINWSNLILALVLVVLMLTTAIGNLFVMVAILVERNLRHIGNHLVLSLAVADLLVACLVMPLAAIYLILDRWTLGLLLCDVWTSADVFCCTGK